MSKLFPFVSEARYQEAQRTIAELTKERERLTDRILTLSGQAPLYSKVEVPEVSLAASAPVSSDPPPPPPRRHLTREDVIRQAERAASTGKLNIVKRAPIATEERKHG